MRNLAYAVFALVIFLAVDVFSLSLINEGDDIVVGVARSYLYTTQDHIDTCGQIELKRYDLPVANIFNSNGSLYLTRLADEFLLHKAGESLTVRKGAAISLKPGVLSILKGIIDLWYSVPPTDVLEAGTKVSVVRQLGNWLKITTETGKNGWI